jgi:arginase family enzyme
MDIEELLYGISPEREPTKEAQAITLIHEMLRGGEVASAEVYRRLADYDISKRTAENAKSRIGVVSIKQGAAWTWKLPY